MVEIELVELDQQTSLGGTIFTGISHYMGLHRGYYPQKKCFTHPFFGCVLGYGHVEPPRNGK